MSRRPSVEKATFDADLGTGICESCRHDLVSHKLTDLSVATASLDLSGDSAASLNSLAFRPEMLG